MQGSLISMLLFFEQFLQGINNQNSIKKRRLNPVNLPISSQCCISFHIKARDWFTLQLRLLVFMRNTTLSLWVMYNFACALSVSHEIGNVC